MGLCGRSSFEDGQQIMPYLAVDSQWPMARHSPVGEGCPVVVLTSLAPFSGGGAGGIFGSICLDDGYQGFL